MKLFTLLALAAATYLPACERESPNNGIPPAAKMVPRSLNTDTESPNPNAARYGPHGVTATPPTAPGPAQTAVPADGEPPLEAAQMGDMAGHACHCGASCKCGHCAGAVPGCHCKAERSDSK